MRLGRKIYPYLLRHLEMTTPNQVWTRDITTILGGKGLCDSDLCDGHLQQKESVK